MAPEFTKWLKKQNYYRVYDNSYFWEDGDDTKIYTLISFDYVSSTAKYSGNSKWSWRELKRRKKYEF
jgi:hypothetical protein